MHNGRMISVIVARPEEIWPSTVRWRVDPAPRERKLITLLGRLTPSNDAFQDFYLLPNIDHPKRFFIARDDPWLKRGRPMPRLSDFCEMVSHMVATRRRQLC